MSELLLTWQFIERIAITLAIGALLGMEREHSKKQGVAGVRTFALVSLLGTMFVYFAQLSGNDYHVLLGFVAVMLLVSVLYASNLFKYKAVGMTTSIALLMSYVLGVFVAYGNVTEAVFITIIVALVMFLKNWLHRFIDELTNAEVLDFLEFLALVGIVYPLVPVKPLVLYGITINLMDIWTLVFMLAIINFVGFVGTRYVSEEYQIELMCILGGLVSSTAILYSMTQAYAKNKAKEQILASAYMFINASMFMRNLVILGVLLPVAVNYLVMPIIAASLFLIICGALLIRNVNEKISLNIESPFQVQKSAYFIIKLTVVIMIIETVVAYLPDILYIAAFFGGITSSVSTMASLPILVSTGKITAQMAAIAATIALLGDLLVGNVIVYYLGGALDAAKKALPYGIVATVVYAGVLALIM